MNSRMLLPTAALAVAGLLNAAVALAQSAAPANSTAPSKVGVINIRSAIGTTAEGKQAQAELQSQFAPRQTEIENLNKQINELRQRLTACEGKCSQEEIARLTTQGQRLTQQLDRKNTEFQEDSSAALGDVMDRIGRKMVDVLDRYARENGFTVVLDSSAQNNPLLYVSQQIDLTQEIIRLYDAAYPIKAAPASQKPAASKPAPTPTKPQQ